eukprot:6166231-Pleurochrysis_carterae.AAC.2
MPGRKRASIGTGPSGLAPSPASRPLSSVGPRGLLLRGRALRSRPLRLLAEGGSAGWVSSNPLGIGSAASSALPAGAKLRSDAKAGGVVRAAVTQAWMDGVRRGPSATLPPATSPRALPPPPGSAPARSSAPAARSSMSASTSFIRAG